MQASCRVSAGASREKKNMPSTPSHQVRAHAWRILAASTLLLGTATSWGLTQATGDKAAYEQARTEAAHQYRSAQALCGKQSVRDKDVCQATAKAERTKRETRAEALYKGTPEAAHQARLAIAQADLQASLRFCDQRAGATARTCKLEARKQFQQAKAEADQAAKDRLPIDKALGEAGTVHANDARACDTLEGGAKHVCLGRAAQTASAPSAPR